MADGQSGLAGGIQELQEWNHGLARDVADLGERISILERRAGPLEADRSLYLALSALGRAHERIGPEPSADRPDGDLTVWELRGFSQNGEDGVLAEILRRVGAPTRFFVEFGAETGKEGNCVLLADVVGWSGLFIEGNDDSFAGLERKYRELERVTTIQAMVTPRNVQELFARAPVPREPDVLSIDVDGTDYWIWEAITDYRPRVVVIEYNALLDLARKLVQPREVGTWDGSDYYGASIAAIRSLGESKGYRLVHAERSGNNAFLVDEELAEGRFASPDEVPSRLPNHFMVGYRHPHDPHGRRYLNLDTGEMVDGARRGGRE